MNKKIVVNDGPLIDRLNESLAKHNDSGKTETDTLREFEESLADTYNSIRDCVPTLKSNAGLDLLKKELKNTKEMSLTERLNENIGDGCKKTYEKPTLIEKEMEPTKLLTANYEYVNHPTHYNNYDVEVIDMMRGIWGDEATALWCKMTAYKYRMRMGTKLDNDILQDLAKEQWYLSKAKELSKK